MKCYVNIPLMAINLSVFCYHFYNNYLVWSFLLVYKKHKPPTNLLEVQSTIRSIHPLNHDSFFLLFLLKDFVVIFIIFLFVYWPWSITFSIFTHLSLQNITPVSTIVFTLQSIPVHTTGNI